LHFLFDATGNAFFSGDYTGTQLVAPDRTLANADPTGATSDAYAGRFNADGSLAWFESFASDKSDQVFAQLDPAFRERSW
jgi:hypothetical protein